MNLHNSIPYYFYLDCFNDMYGVPYGAGGCVYCGRGSWFRTPHTLEWMCPRCFFGNCLNTIAVVKIDSDN